MRIAIIGGGNMGSAIAFGLSGGNIVKDKNITVINRQQSATDEIKAINSNINAVVNDYSALREADVVILCVKPWLIESVIKEHKPNMNNRQIILSIAAGITLDQLSEWFYSDAPVYRIMPNTAIAIRQSMTFICGKNVTKEQDELIKTIFDDMGKAMIVEEKTFPAVTSLSGCGIAFAFRYIRASMVAGVEMGVYPEQSKEIILQTLRGAIELLEANGSHPEAEIDKVTTPGGITIKGLNEMEHGGFTSSVIRGLKASYSK